MIKDIVEQAEKRTEERRKYIEEHIPEEDRKSYYDSCNEEMKLIRTAATALENNEPLSTKNLSYVLYRHTMWALFAQVFGPGNVNPLIEDAVALCTEFGNEELGTIEAFDYNGKHEVHDVEKSQLVWLIRAYNCRVAGIDVSQVVKSIRETRHILYEDKKE